MANMRKEINELNARGYSVIKTESLKVLLAALDAQPRDAWTHIECNAHGDALESLANYRPGT